MTPRRRTALIGAFTAFAFFTLLAGQFWRNLLGWWGFGAIALLVLIGAVVLVVVERPRFTWRRVPKSTFAFVGIATISIAWSFYPGASAIGTAVLVATTFAAVAIALSVPWPRLSRSLGTAIKWILGLSLAFELWVSIFIRTPMLPNFVDYGDGKIPLAFYWSRNLLFEGGPIQGIVASRNILGMIALLGLILFAVALATRTMRRGTAITWLTIAALVFVLTRSATVILVAFVVFIALTFALWARRRGPDRRRAVYWGAGATVAASVALLTLGWNTMLALFGKGSDLTGRLDIWNAVASMASERPVFGWGWVGYWAPWVEPFDDLAVRKGVVYLQAHNAWLDVWMQIGIIGLIAFASIVIGSLWRSWFIAVDRPHTDSGGPIDYSAAALTPLLLLVALLAQSLAESRILVEGGWALLIIVAWATKQRQWRAEPLPPGRVALPRRSQLPEDAR